MNALSRAELRPMSARQAQARLERMLANRRAVVAAREAKFRKLRVSRTTAPKPEPFTWIDSAVFLTPMFVVAVLILIARWSGWLA